MNKNVKGKKEIESEKAELISSPERFFEAHEPGTMHRTVKYLMMKCLTVHFIAQP